MASSEIDEFFVNLDNGPSTSKQSVGRIPNQMDIQNTTEPEDDVEYVEENIVAEIIQLDDGEFYVAVPEDAQDFDIDTFNNIQIVVNDDGTETLIFENEPEPEGDETGATGRTQFQDSAYDDSMMYGNMLSDSGLNVPLSSLATAESGDEAMERENYEMLPGGMKHRRNRVYGACRCPDCGQSFVNTARLERHLAVHQIFGSFLCPLCGKTYKYEYNLFYHWRKTCRDMNELLKPEDRKTIEVNMLRQLVEEIAQKKAAIGSIELGISGHHLYRDTHLEKLENPPSAVFGRRGAQCKACNVLTLAAHMPRHMAVHRGEYGVDERSIGGGYFCDLCGLMFRLHSNLIKHWRTSCPEIQANLPEDEDLALDDAALKEMVANLLRKAVVSDFDLEDPGLVEIDRDPSLASARPPRIHPDAEKAKQLDNLTADLGDTDIRDDDIGGMRSDKYRQGGERDERFDTRWADEQGIVFADDFIDDDEAMLIDEHGNIGSLPMSAHSRAKWTISGMPVQCTECFRTFANAGRLERHLAGFHASYGSHHCVLCGNRFKYDYNLLYHYRRSCPYTKAFIERDVREQLDATNLRKLVRTLAQKEVRLAPQLANPVSQKFHKRDFGDSFVRRQMLKSILPTNNQSQTIRPPPAAAMQQPPRPGLSNGRECPVCSVVFYGGTVLEKHMKVAHPIEYQSWDPDLVNDLEYENRDKDIGRRRYKDNFHEELEPPPALEPVIPGDVEEPPMPALNIRSAENVRHQIVDEHGNVITEVSDLSEVQRLIESGQLEVRDGDQIVIMDQDGAYGEGAFQFMGEGLEPYYEPQQGQQPSQEQLIPQQQEEMSTRQFGQEEDVPQARRSPRRSIASRPTPSVLGPGKRGRGKKRPHAEEFEGENDETALNQSHGSTEGLEVAQILSGMAQEQSTPGTSQENQTPLRRSARRREVSMRSE
uniref:C2H2-type domain-containing protein n=1 Tax=Acrobeloides nanus TaxID=290746 RepID=A0A914CWU5_9BILA